MAQRDTLDKIIGSYFRVVTKEKFTWRDVDYEPRPLVVRPDLLRGYTCPARCGGCCFRFSLDYIPAEEKPDGVRERMVTFSERTVRVWSIMQDDSDHFCGMLNKADGRCGIYPVRPFSCDFELIRFFCSETRPNKITQMLYTRGWAFTRVDGAKGNLCEMTEVTDSSRDEAVRKLKRLKAWTDHFGIETWVPEIIDWVQRTARPCPPSDPLCLGFDPDPLEH